MVGSAEAAHAAQVAQLKEELYADLTGLILRGVDRTEDEDVYDCIQTGRNGSMLHSTCALIFHFLLTVMLHITNASKHCTSNLPSPLIGLPKLATKKQNSSTRLAWTAIATKTL